MEFEIENIPEDALRDLLNLVRAKLGPMQSQKQQSLDDGEPASNRPSGKGKRSKPMTESERGAALSRLESQLESFNNPQGNDGQTQDNALQSSDDDDESGSESEEE